MNRPILVCSVLALASVMLVASPSLSLTQEQYPERLHPYANQLHSELRAYVTAQEAYFADHATYGMLDMKGEESGIDFSLPPGFRLMQLVQLGPDGHWLIVSHDEALELVCAVYVGDIEGRGTSTLDKVLPEAAPEGLPGCRVFQTIRVCAEGDASPSLLNWNYCPRHGNRLRDSVPNPEPVHWDRSHNESDRADIATLTLGASSLEVVAHHFKVVPDSLAPVADHVVLRVTQGDSMVKVGIDAHHAASLLDAMTREPSTAVAITDDLVPTTLTVRLTRGGGMLAFSCAGESGCRPAGPYVLTLGLSDQDVRDFMRALEQARSALEEYSGVGAPGAP